MALLWARQGCPDGLLLQGEALDRAVACAAAHPADLLDQERDLLERSQEAAQRNCGLQRQSALLRALLTLVIVAGLAAMHLILRAGEQAAQERQARIALEQEALAREAALLTARAQATAEVEARRRAQREEVARRQQVLVVAGQERQARSHALVDAALDAADRDPELALLLAAEAADLWRSNDAPAEVRAALHRAAGRVNWAGALSPTKPATPVHTP